MKIKKEYIILAAVIVALAPGEYTVTWLGEDVPAVERYPGTLEIQLPQGPWVGELRINRA